MSWHKASKSKETRPAHARPATQPPRRKASSLLTLQAKEARRKNKKEEKRSGKERSRPGLCRRAGRRSRARKLFRAAAKEGPAGGEGARAKGYFACTHADILPTPRAWPSPAAGLVVGALAREKDRRGERERERGDGPGEEINTRGTRPGPEQERGRERERAVSLSGRPLASSNKHIHTSPYVRARGGSLHSA